MSEKLLNKTIKLVNKAKFDKAIDLLKGFLEINQNSAKVWSYLAQTYMLQCDFENVIKYANKALDIEPNLKSAINQLFLAYDQTDTYDKEWNLLKRYVQIHDFSSLKLKKVRDLFLFPPPSQLYFRTKKLDDPDYLNQLVLEFNPLSLENPYLEQIYTDGIKTMDQDKLKQLYILHLIFNLDPSRIIDLFLLSSFRLSKIIHSEKQKDVLDLLITLFPEKMDS